MNSQESREPAAELGLLDARMIGVGAMIGAGIFVLTGLAAEIAGPAALFVFMLSVVVTAITGLSYAGLESAIPIRGALSSVRTAIIGTSERERVTDRSWVHQERALTPPRSSTFNKEGNQARSSWKL